MHGSVIGREPIAARAAPGRPLEFAVVIPTFNEAANIAILIDRLADVLADFEWEVVVVDDWSTDGTPDVVERLAIERRNVRLIRRYGRRGLSSAVVEGMLATAAPVVAVIDGDLQHDEAILPALHAAIRDGADVAVGTRYAAGGSTGDWGARRLGMSRMATRIAAWAGCPPLSDPMSGLFAIRRDAVLGALPGLSNVGFKVLLDMMLSSPRPLSVREVPYSFRNRVAGESKLDSSVLVEFALLLLDKALRGQVSPRFVLFASVGALGLIVNVLTLSMMLGVGLHFKLAQSVAVAAAILFNYSLNNVLTYRDRRLRGWRWLGGLGVFALICGLGAIANVGIGSLVYHARHAWWTAGIAGAAVGSLWNYLASSAFTWKRR